MNADRIGKRNDDSAKRTTNRNSLCLKSRKPVKDAPAKSDLENPRVPEVAGRGQVGTMMSRKGWLWYPRRDTSRTGEKQ